MARSIANFWVTIDINGNVSWGLADDVLFSHDSSSDAASTDDAVQKEDDIFNTKRTDGDGKLVLTEELAEGRADGGLGY